MDIDIEKSATLALVQLASAQDRMADDMGKVVQQTKEINGHVREHATQLALDSQWMQSHIGPDSIHDVMSQRLDAMEKLTKVAIAIPTIIVVGGAVAGILALVL